MRDTNNCPNAMIIYDCGSLGIQGHPEFSAAYNQALYMRRQDIIDSEIIDEAQASMSKGIDSEICIRWISRFIEQQISTSRS